LDPRDDNEGRDGVAFLGLTDLQYFGGCADFTPYQRPLRCSAITDSGISVKATYATHNEQIAAQQS